MGSANGPDDEGRRFFVGIGVGCYDDPSLNLAKAESDVVRVAEWFTERSGVRHDHALEELAKSPATHEIIKSLRDFLAGLSDGDVVVIYIACHGELDGARPYLFGRDTPRERLAGQAIEAGTLGAIVGQSRPHNVLLIVDACVAGRLGSAIQRAAEDESDARNNRDPHRPHSQVVLASTFGRDPANDGRFAEAFLRVVSDERWTGTRSRWIDVDHLIRGLNEELKDIAPTQVAERRVWGSGAAELIPNPNLASRRLGQLMADADFAAHFDPAARGVAPGEQGTFFTGRIRELRRITAWLQEPAADAAVDGAPLSPALLVITGSPGSGKSALLSRIAVLSDAARRPGEAELAKLPVGTVPPGGALDAVVWCHNKTERQIIEEIASALGGSAATPGALLELAETQSATIALDALDEIADGRAREIAERVLRPLARISGMRLLVATRRRPVRDGAGGEADLLDRLGKDGVSVIDLDESPDRRRDMRDYIEVRIRGLSVDRPDAVDPAVTELAEQIADAAGLSFLVASIAARAAAAGQLKRADGRYVLPTEVGEALAAYIEALPDPARGRGVLRPLAWARGAGLPWGTLWPTLAAALAQVTDAPDAVYDDEDIRALLAAGGDLVVESVEAAGPVYRLFHEALAEHLRADTEEAVAHDALARAMERVAAGRPWHQVPRYVNANLPAHLLGAGRVDDLMKILVDPTWDRQRREETGDPLAAVGIADAAIEQILADSPTDLRAVPLCVVHSRAMTAAAPLILDVLARSGQLARAEMMAGNLTYVPDRMLAFRHLCGLYTRERDTGSALRCFEQVRRTRPAMPHEHQPMAWFWVVEAALAAGRREAAEDATSAAVEAAFALEGDGWDRPNGFFWAARACARTDWAAGTERIRRALDALDEPLKTRNQSLQAASASSHRDFLEARLAEYLDGNRYPMGMIRDGNLALALVDAGMADQAATVFDLVGQSAPEGNADSNKRFAWALALSGQMPRALSALESIGDTIETGKAIARIAEIAFGREDDATLAELIPRVQPLLDGYEPRAKARLVRVLWLAGAHEQALSLAEREIATGHASRMVADPRDGGGAEEGLAPMPAALPRVKTGRREMVTSVVPVPDEQSGHNAIAEAGRGNLEAAREHLSTIEVPLFRAQALSAIASHEPEPERAIASWLRGMADARRAGRGVVDEVLATGFEVLRRAGREQDAAAMEASLAELDARWELESFAEQYESLRRTMPPGATRTRRMEALLLVPHRLARTHSWTPDDIRAAWESEEDGRRLFALALMTSNPNLAIAEILVEAIRESRSAFEQYHALRAATNARLDENDAALVRAAVDAEVRAVPRPDGTASRLTVDSERMILALRLLDRRPGR